MENKFECDACHRVFYSANSLRVHYRFCKVGGHIPIRLKRKSRYKTLDGNYLCECGRIFYNSQSLNAHFSFCMKHKHELGLEEKISDSKIRRGNSCNFSKNYLGDIKFDSMHQKSGETYHNMIQNEKVVPSFFGRHHTDCAKEKIRKSTASYLLNVKRCGPRYNKKSIPILESISKQHGWNIQHAENGGEFYTGIGYFVDAYDKDRNIVLEFDEPKHYVDVNNNILKEKDIVRQNRIIDYLGCDFYRYNEKTKTLWKVN